MLNKFPRSIGAVSGTNTSVVLVRYGYVGLVQVSGYHRVAVPAIWKGIWVFMNPNVLGEPKGKWGQGYGPKFQLVVVV